MSDKTRILLCGAGAVGVYFCGRMAQGGMVDVSVLCRSDYDVVKEKGYHVSSPAGDFDFHPAGIYRSAAEYPGDADYIIVTSKVLPEVDVPAMIRAAVRPHTAIVLIQNGIEIEKTIVSAFPDNELISSIAYIGVTRTAPGMIVHTDSGKLKFGVFPNGISAKADKLAQLFSSGKIVATITPEIMRARWEKLLWNVPFNPISVLTQSDTARIMADPECLQLVRSVMLEVAALADADGWTLPETLIDELLEFTRNFPPYKPSMYVDFLNKRPMEIEAIVGNVVRIAERLHVSVPHIFSIYAMLKRLAGA